MVLAAELLGAIRGLTPSGGIALSASMGVAGCEAGCLTSDELVRRASAAQAWAKYHGKGRVVRFDERIVRALGVEERLRVHEDRSGMDVARALIAAADARDPRNYYHARNVASLAVLLGDAVGLESEHVRRLELAAMLHDIGKLGLPESLLVEVLRTARQQMAVRAHATIGETLVQSLGVYGVGDWVRHHHERWDGAGYPDGLSGDQIPLESRIIALADAFDIMTSARRTRSPMSRGAALQEIDLGMGSRFDPMLAETFIHVVAATASLGWSDEWANA
jgi:HD-GYP domain-containing protein (c-di-GMP phosphodiesterase class II)